MKRIFVIILMFAFVSSYAESSDEILTINKEVHAKKSEYFSEKEKWEQDKLSLEDKYAALERAIRENRKHLEALKDANKSLRKELSEENSKIQASKQINEGLDSLLSVLLDDMESHIRSTAGYSQESRLDSLEKVRNDITSEEMSPQERIRKVIELYTVEADLARFAEVYEEQIDIDGILTSGYLLRLGGAAQFFASPDGSKAAVFNPSDETFMEISPEYAGGIIKAAKILDKRSMPELVNLPVGRVAR